jgi:hypothetical protein
MATFIKIDYPTHINVEDCSLIWTEGTTHVYSTTVRDKNGVTTIPEGEETIHYAKCSLCQKFWRARTQHGKTSFELVRSGYHKD